MTTQILTPQGVLAYLDEIQSGGAATVLVGGLYIQLRKGSDWMFCGDLEDYEEAVQLINDHFHN